MNQSLIVCSYINWFEVGNSEIVSVAMCHTFEIVTDEESG